MRMKRCTKKLPFTIIPKKGQEGKNASKPFSKEGFALP